MDPTNRRIRKIDKDSQRFVAQALGHTNLTLSDYDMIHTVQHRPGITQEQLRQKYAQDKSTIARRAAKLEAGGYIERRRGRAAEAALRHRKGRRHPQREGGRGVVLLRMAHR